MLSIQKCREILEKGHPEFKALSDEQLTQIRDFLYQLAEIEKESLEDLLLGKHLNDNNKSQ